MRREAQSDWIGRTHTRGAPFQLRNRGGESTHYEDFGSVAGHVDNNQNPLFAVV